MLKSLLILIVWWYPLGDTLLVQHTKTQLKDCFRPHVHTAVKLPVWPVWGGVLAQLAEWTGQWNIADKLLAEVGGRVIPITLHDYDVSPFLLLAHHVHSFTPLDPIRAATTLVLPEGFPAHPHSGFNTITITLDGGLRHRDSEGLTMRYGNGDVQYMKTGRGTIHEEMWDLDKSKWEHKRIEIFQLWVNAPAERKGDPPECILLKGNTVKSIACGDDGQQVRLISGSFEESDGTVHVGPGTAADSSPVSIVHATLPAGTSLPLTFPIDASVVVYIRRGTMAVGEMRVRRGDFVVFRHPLRDSNYNALTATATLSAGEGGLDALVLAGLPLREKVLWNGPLVLSSEESLVAKAKVFGDIGAGAYWPFTLKDSEWLDHCQRLNLQGRIIAAQDDVEKVR